MLGVWGRPAGKFPLQAVKGWFSIMVSSQRWSSKRAYALVKAKIEVVSGVVSSTEMEWEESKCFHFLSVPLMTPSFMFQ